MHDDGGQVVEVAAGDRAASLVQPVQHITVHVQTVQGEVNVGLQLHPADRAPSETLQVQAQHLGARTQQRVNTVAAIGYEQDREEENMTWLLVQWHMVTPIQQEQKSTKYHTRHKLKMDRFGH